MDEEIEPESTDEDTKKDNGLNCSKFEEFYAALKILYIKRNQSGRIYFTKTWPVPALYLFEATLIDYDTNGGWDQEMRTLLEEKAIDRQIGLLDLCKNLEEKSVVSGTLQLEYIEELVKSLGRDMALHIYTEAIVDRFIPQEEAPAENALESAEPVQADNEQTENSDRPSLMSDSEGQRDAAE